MATKWKAAFITHKGLFEPTVMFFGLTNSPATFQRFMNDSFHDMIAEGWLVIYMDDLLIFSPNKETHCKRTERVLQRMMELDLHLKLEKCRFATTEVEYLGMIVKPGQLAMDPVKLDGIASWPTPEKVKDVRLFLGFANFYQRFIPNYSNVAHPLIDLTKKNLPWNWSPHANIPLTRSSPCFCPNQSYTPLTLLHPSPWPRMPLNMLLVPSFSKPTPTANGTHVPTSPSRSLQRNGTTTFTTENSSLSSEL